MRYRFAMNPMLHSAILCKAITFAYVHLRGNKSNLGLEEVWVIKNWSNFNTPPLWNEQVMWHITTIWRRHWRRRRYTEDSRSTINSACDDIIVILVVGYVCYSTITGSSSQYSAVVLFDLHVAASERSHLDAVWISALQMGNLTVFNCRLE